MKNKPTYQELMQRVLELEQTRSRVSTKWDRESHLKNVLQAIRYVNHLIARETDPKQLIQKICTSLIQTRGYFNAWIALMDETGEVVETFAASGFDGGFDGMESALHQGQWPLCMRRSLEKDELSVTLTPSAECPACPLSSEYEGRSGLTCRLSHGDRVFGILSVSVPTTFAHDAEEQDLFSELAADLGYALSKLKAEAKAHRLDQILTSIPQPISLVSRDYRYLAVNDVYAELFGTPVQKIIGQTPAGFFGQQVFDTQIRPKLDHVLNGHVLQYEIQADFPGRGNRWMSMSYYPYRNERKEIIGVISHGYDITDRKQAEEALHQSQERFSLAMEASRDGIWDWDLLTGDIYCSPSLTSMLGYDSTEVIENVEQWQDLIHPEDRQRAYQANMDCVDNRTDSFEVEYRMMTRDGGWKWILGRGQAVKRNVSGKALRMIGTHKDISEHKQAEDVLTESKRRFERMLGVVPDMISIHDPRMNILYSNWQGFGNVPGEKRILGTKCFHTYRGFDDLCPDCLAKEVLDTGRPIQKESQLPDGRWVDLRVIPLKGTRGEIEMFMEWVRDITDSKQAQLELQSQKRLLEGVFDSIADVIGIQLPDHTMLRYNRAGYELLGLSEDQVKGRKCYELLGRSRLCEPCASSAVHISKTMETIEQYVPELRKHFICTSNPILDDDGNIKLIIEQLRDVTEKKKMDAAFQQAQKMESIGRLAGGVAHDSNNMLSIILGNTELAFEEMEQGLPVQERLKEIQSAAQRSADIIRQLLAFARRQTIAPKVLDLNTTVENMLKMLRRLIGEDIDLVWRPGHRLWPVKIDPSQVDQILANLSVNARDAIAGVGKLTIETDNVTLDDIYLAQHPGFVPGHYVLLAVSDNGVGMSKTVLENLFEPFYTTKEHGKGTGLGLSTVYGVVKQNNGFVNVYSEPGQGTVFKVYLPRHLTREDIAPEEGKETSTQRGHETILLVEDEPAILKMTAMMLERLGYAVVAARTPGEAIRCAHEYTGRIDLLITDVVMPEMNGRDLAKNILSFYPSLKCLFMSGYTANVIAHHGVLDEGVNFIQKPFSKGDLAVKMREILDKIH